MNPASLKFALVSLTVVMLTGTSDPFPLKTMDFLRKLIAYKFPKSVQQPQPIQYPEDNGENPTEPEYKPVFEVPSWTFHFNFPFYHSAPTIPEPPTYPTAPNGENYDPMDYYYEETPQDNGGNSVTEAGTKLSKRRRTKFPSSSTSEIPNGKFPHSDQRSLNDGGSPPQNSHPGRRPDLSLLDLISIITISPTMTKTTFQHSTSPTPLHLSSSTQTTHTPTTSSVKDNLEQLISSSLATRYSETDTTESSTNHHLLTNANPKLGSTVAFETTTSFAFNATISPTSIFSSTKNFESSTPMSSSTELSPTETEQTKESITSITQSSFIMDTTTEISPSSIPNILTSTFSTEEPIIEQVIVSKSSASTPTPVNTEVIAQEASQHPLIVESETDSSQPSTFTSLTTERDEYFSQITEVSSKLYVTQDVTDHLLGITTQSIHQATEQTSTTESHLLLLHTTQEDSSTAQSQITPAESISPNVNSTDIIPQQSTIQVEYYTEQSSPQPTAFVSEAQTMISGENEQSILNTESVSQTTEVTMTQAIITAPTVSEIDLYTVEQSTLFTTQHYQSTETVLPEQSQTTGTIPHIDYTHEVSTTTIQVQQDNHKLPVFEEHTETPLSNVENFTEATHDTTITDQHTQIFHHTTETDPNDEILYHTTEADQHTEIFHNTTETDLNTKTLESQTSSSNAQYDFTTETANIVEYKVSTKIGTTGESTENLITSPIPEQQAGESFTTQQESQTVNTTSNADFGSTIMIEFETSQTTENFQLNTTDQVVESSTTTTTFHFESKEDTSATLSSTQTVEDLTTGQWIESTTHNVISEPEHDNTTNQQDNFIHHVTLTDLPTDNQSSTIVPDTAFTSSSESWTPVQLSSIDSITDSLNTSPLEKNVSTELPLPSLTIDTENGSTTTSFYTTPSNQPELTIKYNSESNNKPIQSTTEFYQYDENTQPNNPFHGHSSQDFLETSTTETVTPSDHSQPDAISTMGNPIRLKQPIKLSEKKSVHQSIFKFPSLATTTSSLQEVNTSKDPATTTERTLPSSSISSVGVAKEGMVNNFTSLESSNLDDSEINTRVENPETTPVEESIGH